MPAVPSLPVVPPGPCNAPYAHDSSPSLSATSRRRVILAGIAGNVMEWYDFTVYGYFAIIIGRQFFPSEDTLASVIAAFGAFAAGYLMRPFGSMLFGHIADRHGRGTALWISVAAMAVPTVLLGLLPTHDQIGTTAAVLLVALRMLQGLAVGGECGTSYVFLVESGRQDQRGLAGSWGPFGVGCGVLLGSAVGATLTHLISPEAMAEWGWRVPFLFGIVVAGCGLYLRRHNGQLDQAASVLKDGPKSPISEAFRSEWRSIMRLLGISVVVSVAFYLCLIFVATYLQRIEQFTAARALDFNTAAMLVMLAAVPLGGYLSDRIGRRPVMMGVTVLLGTLAWPMFWLMHHTNAEAVLVGQFIFAALVGLMSGVFPALMTELAPQRVRVTVMSFALNLSMATLGGTMPLVAFYLIAHSHDPLSPAWLLMLAAPVSFLFMRKVPETAHVPLR